MVQAANAALLARPAFTIDDSKDDDEETEDDLETGDNDDQVMDEVSLVEFSVHYIANQADSGRCLFRSS